MQFKGNQPCHTAGPNSASVIVSNNVSAAASVPGNSTSKPLGLDKNKARAALNRISSGNSVKGGKVRQKAASIMGGPPPSSEAMGRNFSDSADSSVKKDSQPAAELNLPLSMNNSQSGTNPHHGLLFSEPPLYQSSLVA